MKKATVRRTARSGTQRRAAGRNAAMQAFLMSCGVSESLAVPGYLSLLDSPEVSSAVDVIADVVSNATICLMRNTDNGDVRVRDELSRFMDIHPYALGTRQSLINWVVRYLLTTGDGNAFLLPEHDPGGYLRNLQPMPGAAAVGAADGLDYAVHWRGYVFAPDEVLHFSRHPDPMQPWRGRGLRMQLRDVLQNLKQSSATTNRFLSDKWKPSVIVKVDALADEFSDRDGRRKLLDEYLAGQEAGEPWVIPADLMDVTQVKPLSLADLAISESVELDRRAVAAAVGTPPYLIGVGSYNQAEYNNFVRRTVLPLANGIAQELTRKLLLSPDRYFRVSDRRLYAYTLQELAQVADEQYVRGLMSGNEVRDWLGLPPKEGLDELVMLENYIPAGMIGDQKKLTQGGD